ncbi:hypothetical protein [Nevskia ramosa]|uniref:hypothetical protein n=1 Tax=Nevskia ramosa TaxID=64002 RepID=UPI002356AF5E|nr:hypothetical protein [Nevskia ramosa]
MNTKEQTSSPAGIGRKVAFSLLSAVLGIVSMAALSIAIKAWRSGESTTIFDFVMPVVFLFFFYRCLGSAYVAFTGMQAPWSYEVIKGTLGLTRKQP